MEDVGLRLTPPPVRDPDAEALVAQIRATGQPPLCERGVEGARAYLEERSAASPPGPRVELARDEVVEGAERSVPVRIYRARQATAAPVVVYFHGGGWVIGSVAASDAFCRRLADATDAVIVSVDYALAPEHAFPAAIEDAVAAIEWAAEHAGTWGGDAMRLVVLGDSAGGNIGTVAVRRLVGEGKAIVRRQILAYPGVTADRGASGNPFASEWPLTDADRVWFLDQYVTDEDARTDPDVAPLLADVSDMPPTTILLGGCDPLVDEGLAYARHLWTAGVSVDLHLYLGQFHGFLTLDETILPRSREALGLVANAIEHA